MNAGWVQTLPALVLKIYFFKKQIRTNFEALLIKSLHLTLLTGFKHKSLNHNYLYLS